MTKRNIAIVGCGTGGLAAASFLARDGHNVRMFERFDEPKPLGAGLLLQSTGLACLACLDLDQRAIEYGAQVFSLFGKTVDDVVIFDVRYRDFHETAFGLGIQRGTLFRILYDEVARLGIPVQTGCEISETEISGGGRVLQDRNGNEYGPFDLVIDASGMRSPLRPEHLIRMNRPYPYGAIWALVDDPGQLFGSRQLGQRYDSAQKMVGMLPVGRSPESEVEKCTFSGACRPVDMNPGCNPDGMPGFRPGKNR